MGIMQYVKAAKNFFNEAFQQQCRVLAAAKEGEFWKITCEVQIDPEYTTRKGLGDLVEIYELQINDNQEILSYKLKATKGRASLDEE